MANEFDDKDFGVELDTQRENDRLKEQRDKIMHLFYHNSLEKILNTPVIRDPNAPSGQIFGFQAPMKVYTNKVNEGVSGE